MVFVMDLSLLVVLALPLLALVLVLRREVLVVLLELLEVDRLLVDRCLGILLLLSKNFAGFGKL